MLCLNYFTKHDEESVLMQRSTCYGIEHTGTAFQSLRGCVCALSLLCLTTLDIISIQSQGENKMREVEWFCHSHSDGGRARTAIHRSPDSGSRVLEVYSWTLECWKKPQITQASGGHLKSDKVTRIITIHINTGPGHASLVLSMDVDRLRSNVHLSIGENAQSIPIIHY